MPASPSHGPRRTVRALGGALAVFVIAAACSGGSGDDAPNGAANDPADAAGTSAADTTVATARSTTTAVSIPEVIISVAGPEEVVLDQSESNCDGLARPDLPVRALRTGDQVALTLPHEVNHRLVGTGFDDLTLSCDPILGSTYDHDPSAHAHHEWLAAVYTEDADTVHGVVHNEFHGYESELADSRRALRDGEDDGDWRYLARSGATVSPMVPVDDRLGGGGFSGGGLCAVEFWGAHPDVGCEAVSRWTSDRDGQLVIDVDANKVGVGGDGVIVDVRIDDAAVWQTTLTDDEASTSIRLTEDVAVGSTIDVGVAAGGGSAFDATEIRTIITPDGVRCTVETWDCQM